MRLPSVVSARDLPEQELRAAAMDGELQQLGDAYCSVDTNVDRVERALSIGAQTPEWAIVEQCTAAWVYGAVFELRRPLQLCVDARTAAHPLSTRQLAYREVVIRDEEIYRIGGVRLTAPLRTAIDLARFSDDFTTPDREVVQQLAIVGSFGFENCESAINSRRNLPNKRVALARLKQALERN